MGYEGMQRETAFIGMGVFFIYTGDFPCIMDQDVSGVRAYHRGSDPRVFP